MSLKPRGYNTLLTVLAPIPVTEAFCSHCNHVLPPHRDACPWCGQPPSALPEAPYPVLSTTLKIPKRSPSLDPRELYEGLRLLNLAVWFALGAEVAGALVWLDTEDLVAILSQPATFARSTPLLLSNLVPLAAVGFLGGMAFFLCHQSFLRLREMGPTFVRGSKFAPLGMVGLPLLSFNWAVGLWVVGRAQALNCPGTNVTMAGCSLVVPVVTSLNVIVGIVGATLSLLAFFGVFNAAVKTWTPSARLPLTVAYMLALVPVLGVIGTIAGALGTTSALKELFPSGPPPKPSSAAL